VFAIGDVFRVKHQTSSEVAGRQPVAQFWDWDEPRLLVCEAEFVALPAESHEKTPTPPGKRNSKTNAAHAVRSFLRFCLVC